jgi:hypothetical protein
MLYSIPRAHVKLSFHVFVTRGVCAGNHHIYICTGAGYFGWRKVANWNVHSDNMWYVSTVDHLVIVYDKQKITKKNKTFQAKNKSFGTHTQDLCPQMSYEELRKKKKRVAKRALVIDSWIHARFWDHKTSLIFIFTHSTILVITSPRFPTSS